MAMKRGSGFLAAIIIAVVSFFVVFLFFPEVSDKYFGVSLKHGDASVEKFKEDVQEKADNVVNGVIENTMQDAVETTKKNVSDILNK